MNLLSRIAFICNLLFALCLLIQRRGEWIHQQDINGTIIVLGWLLAPFLNLLFNILYWVQRALRKPLQVPLWLVIANLLFLICQIIVYLILPV